jgi:hypothetical protein
LKVIHILLRLCGLKSSPADLPYSWSWFGLLLAIRMIFHFFSIGDSVNQSALEVILAILGSYGVLLLSFYGLLHFKKIGNRWLQGITAYIGVEIVLLLLVLSCLLLIPGLTTSVVFNLLMALWFLAIKGHVIKHTLDTRAPIAWLIAFNLEIIRFMPLFFLPGVREVMAAQGVNG